MLSQRLRQLDERGLIQRQVYGELPPRVEYLLTGVGKSLAPLLMELCEWAVKGEARESTDVPGTVARGVGGTLVSA
jgi:DNA-binding HxlR family transcriptional regulator